MSLSKLGVCLQVDAAGILETPARPDPHIVIHVGPPVEIGCERGGQVHSGRSVHGDIDIIPSGVASRWILKKRDSALVVRVSQELLTEAAQEFGIDPPQAVLLNSFQLRDARLEHLAWALKTEMDQGFRTGRLYADSIGVAMACQLLREHSLVVPEAIISKPGAMSGFRLRRVLGYIDDNLSGDLSLGAIAAASGLSVSHCQRAFRNTVGLSLHQHVIVRRVERAKSLLADENLSLNEVAAKTGFSHQSHLSYHMRRVLGVTPLSMRKAKK
jgi:AraC family transcriptional regulator